MAHFQLQVAGIGYDGAPAGTGGHVVNAEESGPDADKVYYKVSSGGGITGAIRELLNEQIHTAYINVDDRSTLDNQGVTFRSELDVRNAGASNYVLWRVDPESKRTR